MAVMQAPAITLNDEDRGAFVVRVYQHILAAVGAFVALEVLFFTTGIAERMYDFFFGSGGRWFLLLGLFMVGSWFASSAAADLDDPGRQYMGLFGTALAYSLIFAPFLYYVYSVREATGTLGAAAVLTVIGFAALTAIAMVTKTDLSFLRPIVMWGFMGALLLIVGGLIFGFNLGLWFSVGMVILSGVAILYQTQTMLRQFPANAHVAAATMLFGSLMTMFWYVLQIVLSMTSD